MPLPGQQKEQTQGQPGQGPGSDGAGSADPSPAAGSSAPAARAGTEQSEAAEPIIEIDERRAKMERLRSEGIDPYPHVSLRDRTKIADVQRAHDPAGLAQGEHPELPYHLAGRLISRRGHGKTSFLDLRDLSGSIQIVLRADKLGEEAYERILGLDIGDIVGVRGCVYVTQRGGLAVAAQECTLLTKTLRPPPDKHHGLGDTGTRYRYRELDLIANEDTRELFLTRAKIVAAIREWLGERDFVEVETPALQSLAGGAGSRPFTTHHNALDVDLYLRISVELFLNRCIVGGLENVYDMGKVFRNEGISPKHSPEFTIIEFMFAYADYYDVADATEQMFADVARRVLGRTEIKRGGEVIDLAKPWRRITMREAIFDATGIDFMGEDRDGVISQLKEALAERVHPATTWAELVLAVYTKLIEPTINQPTHVFDFPLEPFPITKRHAEHPELGEHFDAVIGGIELVSGDTELNDPVDQWQRFVDQRKRRTVDDADVPHPNDEEYARAIEHGYSPTAGGGMGVDRLVMILTERESLREVIPFPIVREIGKGGRAGDGRDGGVSMSSKLDLDPGVIEECRQAAVQIAATVDEEISGKTTVSVERTIARLLGVDGANELEAPLPNVLVDHVRERGELGRGIAYWLGNALLADEETSPQLIAEGIEEGKLDLCSGRRAPQQAIRERIGSECERRLAEISARMERRRELRESLGESPPPLRYVLTATGNVYEDVVHGLAVAEAGGDIVAVIRSTAQSLLDYVPYGPTTEGYGGTFATQENFRIMREALDQWSRANGRYVRLSSFCSGLCMPEIAAMGAFEGYDNMVNDALYGILYRDINVVRGLVDQRASRMINAYFGVVINTGEDNYLRTAEAVGAASSVTASQFINRQLARDSGVPDEQIALGDAFEIDPPVANGLLFHWAQAQLTRELFPECPVKYMPPTRHMDGNLFRTHACDSLFNLVTVATGQGIQTIGVPTEGIFTPHVHDRVIGLENVNYVFTAARDLGEEIEFRRGGIVQTRAQEVLRGAQELLSRIAEEGLLAALARGVFGDVPRHGDEGRGIDGIVEVSEEYFNPVSELMRGASSVA